MAPFRQTMCLIEYPAVDLALRNSVNKTGVAELFRRDKQNADIAQSYFV